MAVPANGKLEFTGCRVDLVFKPGAKDPVKVLIDGRKPSQIPEVYSFTRVSSFPNSDWPILLKVNANAPMGAEDWFLKIKDASADGKVCHFTINGSVTGDDGEGVSTNKFVSKSGKIMIEPEDWNLGYCVAVFKRALPENHVATWKRYLMGRDTAVAPAVVPGVTPVVTIAQGLNAAKHQLELSAENLGKVESVRVYAPQP
jgi:hypothetical protein